MSALSASCHFIAAIALQAQQKLGVTTDIHPIAEMLCCDCVVGIVSRRVVRR